MRLLLISNSTNAGEAYLEYPKQQIADFLAASAQPVDTVLFVPYAAVTFSYDDYQAKVAARFTDVDFWEKETDRCLSCGACTYFCPTCYCFNITDEGEATSEKGGRRLRTWDNCMSPLFTREASGHNTRMEKALRMRNRVSHKFSTYPENWGTFSCNGCGRCISNCPVSLDIRQIVLDAINADKAAK